ncbi:MAG TPA: Rpn family recombination-promoting nuclease/putative transposase [Spirochaetales bacterium]|nr:Rpn family recombination-promoting nuclease/putative transposase [Spirochaetales bacterium]
MKDMVNPHDRLFKEIEKIKENSRDLIESTFPQELLEKLDLDTLENDNNSYIDESLKEFYTDLVFNCKYSGNITIKVSILFEHKSYKPENEYLQLLRYILNIWDYSVKNKEKPPIVIPVIFYHGSKKWEVKPLSAYFKGADKNLRQFIPDFKYIFTDIGEIPEEVILKEKFNNINKVMTLLFKHIADEKYLKEKMVEIFSLVREFFAGEKREIIITFLLYIMHTTEIDKEYIRKCLNAISPEGGEIAMTTAMKLREEGKREGIQEGIREGIQEGKKEGIQEGLKRKAIEDAKNMLLDGISIEKAAQYTGLNTFPFSFLS